MEAFGTILVVICVIAVVAAAISYYGSGRIYKGLGRSGPFSMDDDEDRGRRARPAPPAAHSDPEAQEEIRQMLEAKSARREARGEAPLDIDAELASLSSPSAHADPGLREEVRQLVEARNERRMRQGKAPLDVDAEVERQLRELG
jgi:hypothetical protein